MKEQKAALERDKCSEALKERKEMIAMLRNLVKKHQ